MPTLTHRWEWLIGLNKHHHGKTTPDFVFIILILGTGLRIVDCHIISVVGVPHSLWMLWTMDMVVAFSSLWMIYQDEIFSVTLGLRWAYCQRHLSICGLSLRTPDSRLLTAAKSQRTVSARLSCFNGHRFTWDFVVAKVARPLLGADFLLCKQFVGWCAEPPLSRCKRLQFFSVYA